MKLGQVNISEIELDLSSRDEIPRLLMGLQYIYCTPEVREEVFQILEEMIPRGIDANTGRPGMLMWKILVLGTLRLNCNWDYDKLKEIADHHDTLRMMLGHGVDEKDYRYPLQTIKDNVSLFTPPILDKINQVVVKAGHELVRDKGEKIRGRCDSTVVKTDVHFPTDINLLLDAMRKVITLIARLCGLAGLSVWRQSSHNLKRLKRLYRKAQNLKRSKAKSEKKRRKREREIVQAHREYTDVAQGFLEKARKTLPLLRKMGIFSALMCDEIERYIRHAERQIDQIRRRVIGGERIAHDEKVFSIFEEHTEWIRKGKAGVPQELGLRVCVMEDQYGFILHHMVMPKTTDEQVAVPFIEQTKSRYPDLGSCSFDRGFYTPDNLGRLEQILDLVVMPKKGKLSREEQLEANTEEYVGQRRQHSAVESAINALENHGLDRCPDHGIGGFERYVALAVLARNIQTLGNIIFQMKKSKRAEQQKKPYRKAS
jgi:hypothetical protein